MMSSRWTIKVHRRIQPRALRPDDRAPAGDELRGPAGGRQARRGERLRRLLPVDHYASFPGEAGQPTTDAWTVVAGLARETERIGLGVLVSPVTFRHPGVFAKVVTTVDEMSGGRIEVGVGAGWNDDEHRQLGLAFPPIDERADLLEDQLAILHGLWGEPDGWSYDGHHRHPHRGALFRPRPVDVPGRPVHADRRRATADHHRRPGLAALVPARRPLRRRVQPELVVAGPRSRGRRALDAACEAIGRDPSTLTRSTMVGVLVGRTEAEVRDREQRLLAAFGSDAEKARPGSRSVGRAGSTARRTRPARSSPLRRGRGGADHAPGLPALGPRHDRRHGRGARRPGLDASRRR